MLGGAAGALLDSSDNAIESLESSRYMLLGGDKFNKAPHISWNFVTHSKTRMEQAMQRRQDNQFPPVPGDDKEFIPLPVR
jgi:redox-sensitive bicupin YhaK (pirin superfamily)